MPLTSSFNILPVECCKKGWGREKERMTHPRQHPICRWSLDISFEDDVTAILLLGVSFMLYKKNYKTEHLLSHFLSFSPMMCLGLYNFIVIFCRLCWCKGWRSRAGEEITFHYSGGLKGRLVRRQILRKLPRLPICTLLCLLIIS